MMLQKSEILSAVIKKSLLQMHTYMHRNMNHIFFIPLSLGTWLLLCLGYCECLNEHVSFGTFWVSVSFLLALYSSALLISQDNSIFNFCVFSILFCIEVALIYIPTILEQPQYFVVVNFVTIYIITCWQRMKLLCLWRRWWR